MKILFDTNVILDVLLEREPFFKASSQVLGYAELNKIDGWICGTTVTTIHYLLATALTRLKSDEQLRCLFKLCQISTINSIVLEDALADSFKDDEDAVIYHSAVYANVAAILTRNQKDFQLSKLPFYSPIEFLKAIESLG